MTVLGAEKRNDKCTAVPGIARHGSGALEAASNET
jgi:hypothetical protein